MPAQVVHVGRPQDAVLAENDIREGRLVEAWPLQASLAAGYHLIRSVRAARNPAALAMADWLVNETKRYRTPESAPA